MGSFFDRHQPKTVDDLVFADSHVRDLVVDYVNGTRDRHVLLHGPKGSGKSEAARIMQEAMIGAGNIQDRHNARSMRKVDFEHILNAWNAQMGVGGAARGCTVIDEVDQLSDALKDQLQAFADNYRRLGTLICTTNYPEKLSEPLRNRFKNVLVRTPSASDFVQRAGQIMQAEGISLPVPVLADVMAKCDGSIRDYVDHLEDALIGARKVAASAPTSQALPAFQSCTTP